MLSALDWSRSKWSALRTGGSGREAAAGAIRVDAWRDALLEREMLANGFVNIGGDELGDLTGLDLEEIGERLTEAMDRSPRAINVFVGCM